MKRFLKESPLYLFLFSIYPVIFLFANNFSEIDPILVIRPFLIFLLLGSVFFLVFLTIVRKAQRATFYAFLMLVFFFLIFFILYAPVYQGLRNVEIAGTILGRHRILIPFLFLLMLLLGLLLILQRKRISGKFLDSMSFFLNLTASILLVFSLINISIGILQNIKKDSKSLRVLPVEELDVDQETILPDIYYIILDMHTNDNVLPKFHV